MHLAEHFPLFLLPKIIKYDDEKGKGKSRKIYNNKNKKPQPAYRTKEIT